MRNFVVLAQKRKHTRACVPLAECVVVTMVQLQINYQRANVHVADSLGVMEKIAKGYIAGCCHICASQGVNESCVMWL